jgi:hypothetical protein
MRATHENAVHRTWLDTQSAKHALGIVNRKARDTEPLAILDPFLADVDAIHGTCLGTLITRDARGQVVTMKTAVTSGYRDRFFGINEVIGERLTFRFVRDQPVSKCDPKSLSHSGDGQLDIAEPSPHRAVSVSGE